MVLSMLNRPPVRLAPHPNDLDRKRIERALQGRKRYRYVTPRIDMVAGGYQIVSPCCSRNIDPDGGLIDVARLLHDDTSGTWALHRKDHSANLWELDSTHARLTTLLDRLNTDPDRMFWR